MRWNCTLESESGLACICGDESRVAAGHEDGTIRLIDSSKGVVLSTGSVEGVPLNMEFAGNGLLVSTKPHEIKIEQSDDESEKLLALNMLAARNTPSSLWKLTMDGSRLAVTKSLQNRGGFALRGSTVYVCHSEEFRLFAMDEDLNEKCTVNVSDPPKGRPWFSSIALFDHRLLLFQEDDQVRLFDIQGETPVELGTVKPENPHRAYFISVNRNLEGSFFRTGDSLICRTEDESVVIDFSRGNPEVIDDRIVRFPLKQRNLFTVADKLAGITETYGLAFNKYVLAITRPDLSEVIKGIWFPGFSLTEARAAGNRAYLRVWDGDYADSIIVLDMDDPENPEITWIINRGTPATPPEEVTWKLDE